MLQIDNTLQIDKNDMFKAKACGKASRKARGKASELCVQLFFISMVIALFAGCTRSGDDPNVIDLNEGDVQLTSRLISFSECDDLLEHIRTEYSKRVGPYGFMNTGVFAQRQPSELMEMNSMDDMNVMPDSMDSQFAAPSSSQGGVDASAVKLVEGVDYSGTNLQEIGVDEADIVKTDGERIFVVSDNKLVVVSISDRSVIGSLDIGSELSDFGGFAANSSELFIDGNNLILIYQSWVDTSLGQASLGQDRLELNPTLSRSSNVPSTLIARIDLTESNPQIVDTLQIEGQYVSARSVGSVARVIVDNPLRLPMLLPGDSSDRAADAAEQANRDIILKSTIEDWLPRYFANDLNSGSANGGSANGGSAPPFVQLGSCDNVYAPSVFSGFGMTTVISVPMSGDFKPDNSTTIMAPGRETVYASTESVYIATTNWLNPSTLEEPVTEDDAARMLADVKRTSIHRFDISNLETAQYEASGSVPGAIHNQFSLSEHKGYLRVVTTTDTWTGAEFDEFDAEFGVESSGLADSFALPRRSSQVRVLRQEGDALVEVGSVGDIGRGENVHSVRFVGDVGYVVTFRQIDPFYTIDLSDPLNPQILGELKIPGFSSYLHPIREGFVLGVGSDATDQGRLIGAKVSLFDVRDLENPKEVAVWVAPGGWNSIGWDHRAFLWWAPENLAVIPVTTHTDTGASWSGAVVLRVSDSSIVEVGRISNDEDAVTSSSNQCRGLLSDDFVLGNFTTGLQNADKARELIASFTYYLDTGYYTFAACKVDDTDTPQVDDTDTQDGENYTDTRDVLPGFECYPDEETRGLMSDLSNMGIEIIAEDEVLWFCAPFHSHSHNMILRNIVSGDELWSLSYLDTYNLQAGILQANDLATLERLERLALSVGGSGWR